MYFPKASAIVFIFSLVQSHFSSFNQARRQNILWTISTVEW